MLTKKAKRQFSKTIRNWLSDLALRIKLSLICIGELLKRPPYATIFIAGWYLILYSLTFFRDGSGNWSLLLSNLSLDRKLQILGRVSAEVWSNFFNFYGLALVFLACLQALVFMLLAYAVRHREREQVREGTIDGVSTGLAGALIGFVTLGCPSCGITMLTPILTAIAGAGAVAAVEVLNRVFLFVAFALLFYTIVYIGYLNFMVLYAPKQGEKNAKNN